MPLTPEFKVKAANKELTVAELREFVQLLDLCQVPENAKVSAQVTFKGKVSALGVER